MIPPLYRCLACQQVWQKSQLMTVFDPSERKVCADACCGGTCVPSREEKVEPQGLSAPNQNGWWWVINEDGYKPGDEICVEVTNWDTTPEIHYGARVFTIDGLVVGFMRTHWFKAHFALNPEGKIPVAPAIDTTPIKMTDVIKWLEVQPFKRQFNIGSNSDDPAAHIMLGRGAKTARAHINYVEVSFMNHRKLGKIKVELEPLYCRVMIQLFKNMEAPIIRNKFTEVDGLLRTFTPVVTCEFLLGLLRSCEAEQDTSCLEHFLAELMQG